MTVEKRDVTFKSADNLCAGWFFRPQRGNADKRVPAIAMAHGVGAVKEMYIDCFAHRFAEAGVAALLFDYRFSVRAAASRVSAFSLGIRWKITGVH